MAEAIGLHRCGVVVEDPRPVALGQFYFITIGKGQCAESGCEVEAFAPIEWVDDFGYGDLQDALTSVLQDCDADYVDGIQTALLLYHPDLGADIKDALARRPVSPTDGLRVMDARYRGVSLQFSVFMLALPEMAVKGFGFMPHNPSKRSVLSLDGYLIEARFSSEFFVFRALASFFAGCLKCLCEIDGSGAFVGFPIVMPAGEVWSLEVIDLVGRRASESVDGEVEEDGLAALIEKRAAAPVADDGVKRFLAIYALGREGAMPDEIDWEAQRLDAFDAAAIVWTDKSVAFIKGGLE